MTPTKDFVGTLTAASRQMIALIIALIAVEVVLIRILATRLSRPIEGISRQLRSVESLSFDNPSLPNSRIREIAQLQSAAALLHSSLQSFSSFVPLDIVRQLIASGAPLTLGAEERFLTVFFSDLEDFSTYAEQLPPNELLGRMSTTSRKFAVRSRRNMELSTSSSAMVSWRSGVRPTIDPITFCVPAPVRCGRLEGCRRSATYGPRRAVGGCGYVSGSIARTYWSAISARRIDSATQ